MNPDIYSDPETFDPSRYEEGREEDKKETFGFLGWGVGTWTNDAVSCPVMILIDNVIVRSPPMRGHENCEAGN